MKVNSGFFAALQNCVKLSVSAIVALVVTGFNGMDSNWGDDLYTRDPKLYYLQAVQFGLFFFYCFTLASAFAIVLAGTSYRREPMLRTLFLRPFDYDQVAPPLRAAVATKFGCLGSVFTLSDRNYRPAFVMEVLYTFSFPYFVMVYYFFGPILRLSIRLGYVRDQDSFLSLSKRVDSSWRLAFYATVSGGQALNIRSTDEWWQKLIGKLLNSCDVIVMDVTKIGSGSSWEIDQLNKLKALDRCVFIELIGNRSTAGEKLKDLLNLEVEPFVHLYGSRGTFFQDDRMTEAINAAVLRYEEMHPQT